MLSKKFALGFGIAIILPMMICYGVRTFSPALKFPTYNFYGNYYQDERNATPEQKIKIEQKRQEQIHQQTIRQEEYKDSEKQFQQNLFYAAVPLGIIAILFGAFTPIQAVGTGLMFGGIFTLIEGYIGYWSALEDWMRFVSLLMAFIILIYIGYRKLAK